MPAAAMTTDEIAKLLHEVFPQAFYPGCGLTIERVEYASIRVRRHFQEHYIRPGGTISGPTMMELADFAMYVAVLKVGKRLAVGEVAIYSDGVSDPVAHVTSTYSIPTAN